MSRRYVYMHYQQQEIYYSSPRHIRYEAARRTGKTAGQLAPTMHRVQKSMPGGGGGFIGNSNKQLMSRTIPAVVKSWKEMFHLVEGENFIFGRPPSRLNYPDPIYKPKEWSNELCFANGWHWTMASLAVTGSLNGRTLSYLCGDESKFWSKEALDGECMPTLSGETPIYGADDSFSLRNPFYKGTDFVSDASLSAKGNWLSKEEAKMDIPIETGPNKGRTSRELLKELIEYADHVIDINDVVYAAKQAGVKPLVKSDETIAYLQSLAQMIRERHDKFHAGNGKLTKDNLNNLVRYRVITSEDAELLYQLPYIIRESDYLYSRLVDTPKFKEHILQLRRDCFGYFRGSTIDNIALLGEDYIRQMRNSLPRQVFEISILGLKPKKHNTGFYYALDVEDEHGYIDHEDNGVVDNLTRVHKVSHAYNGKTYTAEVESPDFEAIGDINDSRLDGDLHADDVLTLAFDAGNRFNCCVCGVVRKNPDTRRDTLYYINSFFVKDEEKIEALIANVNRYYAPHRRRNRNIIVYTDSTFASKDLHYAQASFNPNRPESIADTILRLLTAAGWAVTHIYIGNPMDHDVKYREINNGLKGISWPAVRINREKNEDLIVSLENAGTLSGYGRDGRKTTQKDKSGEKLDYNPDMDDGGTSGSNVRYEWRTDFSDAFDTLYIGTKYFRHGGGAVFACG